MRTGAPAILFLTLCILGAGDLPAADLSKEFLNKPWGATAFGLPGVCECGRQRQSRVLREPETGLHDFRRPGVGPGLRLL